MSDPRSGRSASGRRKTSAPTLPRLMPVAGISIERQVYDTLRAALMGGAIAPGAGLASRPLSEALGVSPMPVREALKRLEADGAVTGKSKSAFFVDNPDQTVFAEIYEARLELEGLAIRKAAKYATENDLPQLRRINDEYQQILAQGKEANSYALQVNFRFHFEMYRLSRSATLLGLIEGLWLRVGPTLQHYVPDDGARSIVNFHNRMLDALVAHDPAAAERALHDDLEAGYRIIRPMLSRKDAESRSAAPHEDLWSTSF